MQIAATYLQVCGIQTDPEKKNIHTPLICFRCYEKKNEINIYFKYIYFKYFKTGSHCGSQSDLLICFTCFSLIYFLRYPHKFSIIFISLM